LVVNRKVKRVSNPSFVNLEQQLAIAEKYKISRSMLVKAI